MSDKRVSKLSSGGNVLMAETLDRYEQAFKNELLKSDNEEVTSEAASGRNPSSLNVERRFEKKTTDVIQVIRISRQNSIIPEVTPAGSIVEEEQSLEDTKQSEPESDDASGAKEEFEERIGENDSSQDSARPQERYMPAAMPDSIPMSDNNEEDEEEEDQEDQS